MQDLSESGEGRRNVGCGLIAPGQIGHKIVANSPLIVGLTQRILRLVMINLYRELVKQLNKQSMPKNIYPCLWFDGNGNEAADLYCSIFENSKRVTDTAMVITFELEGKKMMALNGGPMFKKNQSISFFVTCASDEETQHIWDNLIDGGQAMMELDKYPWSEKYGWLIDKFGMSWQLMRGELNDPTQKIIPALLFVGEQYGKAMEAIEKYMPLFPNSRLDEMQVYGKEDAQQEGKVKFAKFHLDESAFAAMDGFGTHEFSFNEGVSLVVECDTQQEIDFYWQKLTEGGSESMCGWLKDEFGVSWQIVPQIMGKLATDKERSPRVFDALMKMKKIDIAALENA